MDSDQERTNSYRVEVSGWDAKENFFVEKALLDWKCEGVKEIALRTRVRKGCVIFVRLMQPVPDGDSYPIPYQTLRIASKDANGRMHVSVEQLRPRSSSDESLTQKIKAIAKVS